MIDWANALMSKGPRPTRRVGSDGFACAGARRSCNVEDYIPTEIATEIFKGITAYQVHRILTGRR